MVARNGSKEVCIKLHYILKENYIYLASLHEKGDKRGADMYVSRKMFALHPTPYTLEGAAWNERVLLKNKNSLQYKCPSAQTGSRLKRGNFVAFFQIYSGARTFLLSVYLGQFSL